MRLALKIYHLIVDNKIPTISGSLCFFIILNGGSFFFLFINIASYFISNIEEELEDYLVNDLLKTLILYLVEHNINLKYSVFLVLSSVYSSSTLYYHFLNGIEMITTNNIKFNKSKRLISIVLVFVYIIFIFIIVFVSSILKIFFNSFFHYTYLITIVTLQLFLIITLNMLALKTFKLKLLYKGIIFSLFYYIIFTLGFLLYLEVFTSFKIVYGVLSFFIILLFYLYILAIGLLLGIYYNWYKLTEYNNSYKDTINMVIK